MFELSIYFSKFYNIKIFHLLSLLKILEQLYEKEAILTNYQNCIFLFNLSVVLPIHFFLYEIENKLAGSLSCNLSSWSQLTGYYAFPLEQEVEKQ